MSEKNRCRVLIEGARPSGLSNLKTARVGAGALMVLVSAIGGLVERGLYDRYGRRIAKWGGTKCRIDPAGVRFQANGKCFNRPNVLEHSLENRETVECICQFAMLLRVCNRQSS